jgi:thymidylate synthase (FAD)
MKIIKPSFEILNDNYTDKILELIELAGRTCYKSEDKITAESAPKFYQSIVKSGHESVIEHGTIIISCKRESSTESLFDSIPIKFLKYFNITKNNRRTLISANVRAWRDLFKRYYSGIFINFLNEFPVLFEDISFKDGKIVDLEYDFLKDYSDFSVEEKEEHLRVTVKMIYDRGVSHEQVRHRPVSYSQESTRYCSYDKNKFGSQLTFIKPLWITEYLPEEITDVHNLDFLSEPISSTTMDWILVMLHSEHTYMKLVESGWKAQQARSVLPNSLKTEIVVTANIEEWEWMFYKRCAEDAHPQIREVFIPLREEMIKRSLTYNPNGIKIKKIEI